MLLDHADLKIVPAGGKISPSIQFVVQMKALNLISFHDRILNEQELKPKELLLGKVFVHCILLLQRHCISSP